MSDFYINLINGLNVSRQVQKQIHGIMMAQLGIKNTARETAAGAAKSSNWGHLNDVGKRAAKRDELSTFVKSNTQARIALKKLRQDVGAAMPKVAAYDPSDMVGFLADQEKRAFLRSLPDDQRAKAALNPDFAAAIAKAPAALSGVGEGTHQVVTNSLLVKSNGADLAQMANDLEALNWAEQLTREAGKEIRAAGEFAHETDFRTWAKPQIESILKEANVDFDAVHERSSDDPNIRSIFAQMGEAAE
ncbi:hypothetical protein [Bradyrhizobium sp. USDA 313]|uniref:hypothetical protein n=1 Tax=Bradyrhizobium sp. USDA 313 TaxID=3156307 RepID=UPI003519AE71